LEDFKEARSVLVQALADFPKNRRKETLFGAWTLMDVIAHMSGWMIAAANNVKLLKKGEVPPWVESINKFNKENVEKRKSWSWERVYKELIKVSEEFIKEYERLPRELWEKRYWPRRSFTPKKILEIEIKHFRDTHLPPVVEIIKGGVLS